MLPQTLAKVISAKISITKLFYFGDVCQKVRDEKLFSVMYHVSLYK